MWIIGENKNKTSKESFALLDKKSVTPEFLNEIRVYQFNLNELVPKADANSEALFAWASTADGLTPIQASGGGWRRQHQQ